MTLNWDSFSADELKTARRLSIQFAYQAEMQKQNFYLQSAFENFEKQMEIPSHIKPVISVVCKTLFESLSEIDQSIEQASTHWKLHRIGKVDLAILRVCACEFRLRPKLAKEILISDAAEIGKTYGTQNSSQFIHGVLDALLKAWGEQK
jgi:N utilization substance protein B